jgi:parvulin-like peptidyl-prolyl isomerase
MTLIVNGEKIEDSLIQQEVERLRPHYEQVFRNQSPQEQKAQLFDWSRENVIERVLINQEAKNIDAGIPQARIESVLEQVKKQYQSQEQSPQQLSAEEQEKIKEDIKLQMRVERMLQDVCKDIPGPSEKTILEFYNENKEQFKSAEQVRVGHIVKHINWQTDEATAHNITRKAQDELKTGAVFETLVARYSDCPDNGGDLGYITKGQMVEEFEDVVFNLGVNEVSDVFRTRFGFHIAKLYDRKPAVIPALKEVKEHVVSELKEQMRSKAIDEFVDRLKSKAEIEEI